ncbi:MAG: biotin transporter BioY, partial [candidate division WOR-3 bacterium]
MERILRWTLVIPRRQSLIFMTLSFGLAMVFSAYIYIPLPWTPVPITLQTFFVFLSGIILRYYGGLSQILYVGLGAIGLPVFAQGFGGISRIFGPTGGYLIGFIIAAIFIGQFYSIRNFFKGLLILFFGLAII